MKKYRITVDGNIYEVEVEEVGVTDGIQGKGGVQNSAAGGGRGIGEALASTGRAGGAGTPAPGGAVAPPQPHLQQNPAAAGPGTAVKAPMPGMILSVNVTAGQQVAAGDILLILEAMKMENEILAPAAGKVTSVTAAQGASVNTGDILVTLE